MKRMIWTIAFFCIFTAIFSSLFFSFIQDFSASRWMCFAFIHLAWIMLIINLYSFPEVHGGVIFGYAKRELACAMFVLELLLGVIFIFINTAFTLTVFVVVIPFGINLARYLALVSAELHSKSMDKADAENIAFIKEAGISLQSSMKFCKDWQLSKKIESLLDAVKSSQIKHCPAASDAEMKFLHIMEKINHKAGSGETENLSEMIQEAMLILEERNNIIKMTK